jgi:hypothetical protein
MVQIVRLAGMALSLQKNGGFWNAALSKPLWQ